jgi:unsaturated chondroitin disaccharide hydrolase
MSGEDVFRAVSERAADDFLARLEPGRAPAWDFADDAPDVPRDASAGAIAADGLLDLGTPGRRAQGQALLDVLLDTCTPPANGHEEGLLLHQTGDLPHGNAIDVSLIYGDHYFMETLFRLADPEASAVLI